MIDVDPHPESNLATAGRRWDLLQWNDAYATGHAEIDREHQYLFRLVNDFNRAVNEDKDQLVIRGLLDELRDYTQYHFQQEEELMRTYDYPEYARHKKAHDKFIQQIDDVANQLEVGGDMAAFLLSFLTKWLGGHILGADQHLSAFLEDCGVVNSH